MKNKAKLVNLQYVAPGSWENIPMGVDGSTAQRVASVEHWEATFRVSDYNQIQIRIDDFEEVQRLLLGADYEIAVSPMHGTERIEK